jgi:6-phosphogluconate dehydrogenase
MINTQLSAHYSKWTAISALDLGQPLTLIGESVFARCLSAQKAERVAAAPLLPGPKDTCVVRMRVTLCGVISIYCKAA